MKLFYAQSSWLRHANWLLRNRHSLPLTYTEIPSAKEVEENGLYLKEMNLLLLRKIEALTLGIIDHKTDRRIKS